MLLLSCSNGKHALLGGTTRQQRKQKQKREKQQTGKKPTCAGVLGPEEGQGLCVLLCPQAAIISVFRMTLMLSTPMNASKQRNSDTRMTRAVNFMKGVSKLPTRIPDEHTKECRKNPSKQQQVCLAGKQQTSQLQRFRTAHADVWNNGDSFALDSQSLLSITPNPYLVFLPLALSLFLSVLLMQAHFFW